MSGIPKLIHFFWFGGSEKPEIVQKCIASWHKFMPEYKIIEWNEANYDINKTLFMKQAYEHKKWAFVVDCARFDVLYEFGGIYFDTDVELLKPIPDDILENEAFAGFESAGEVNPGLVFGAVKEFPITKIILSEYEQMNFIADGKPVYKTVDTVTTEVLERYQKIVKNEFQVVQGLALYPSNYFCGYDQDVREYDIKPETISVHHYAGTWKDKSFKRQIQGMVKSIVGIEGYRKLLHVKRKFTRRSN